MLYAADVAKCFVVPPEKKPSVQVVKKSDFLESGTLKRYRNSEEQ